MSHTETTEAVQASAPTEIEAILSKMKGWSCETSEYSSEWVYSADDVREALTTIRKETLEEAQSLYLLMKTAHEMELDAISCKSLEEFVLWQDYRKTLKK